MKRLLAYVLSVFALAVCVGLFLYSSSADATQLPATITWSPSTIADIASPGTRQNIPISFTAATNLSNVVVSVVPALQALVTVNPTSFPSLQKGQLATVTMTVAPAATATLAVTEGTIRVLAGTATVAKPLPVQIIIETGGNGLLPPDPGEAGKATIEGIDSDHDGVRDDVERYIAITVPESAKHRETLRSLAKATQGGLSAQTRGEALQVANAESLSIQCLGYLDLLDQDRWKEVQALTVNTEVRLQALAAHNDLISGSVFHGVPPGQERAACLFNLESLPN